jgi:hypothetical protein
VSPGQDDHAEEPFELPRVLVGAEEEHAPHVQEEENDEDAGAPFVHPANEPPEGELVRDLLDGVVRLVGRGPVVHRQDDAGHELDEESGQRGRAKRVEPVRLAGNAPEEEVLDGANETGSLLEPVERREDHRLELLLPPRFPAPRHQGIQNFGG